MTNDSHLFPPRPEWEAKGYRPDEYSRWLLGDWRPMEELWEMLGVDPTKPEPAEIELEDWLFDAAAGPERREAEAQVVHGHWLKPGTCGGRIGSCGVRSRRMTGCRWQGPGSRDRSVNPEHRHTVLTLVALSELESKASDGTRRRIDAFLTQNHGEGWLLPETLRLVDHRLGKDDRAKHPQVVSRHLGPRFYDWQLVQSADQSHEECHIHARNFAWSGPLHRPDRKCTVDCVEYAGAQPNLHSRESPTSPTTEPFRLRKDNENRESTLHDIDNGRSRV